MRMYNIMDADILYNIMAYIYNYYPDIRHIVPHQINNMTCGRSEGRSVPMMHV